MQIKPTIIKVGNHTIQLDPITLNQTGITRVGNSLHVDFRVVGVGKVRSQIYYASKMVSKINERMQKAAKRAKRNRHKRLPRHYRH